MPDIDHLAVVGGGVMGSGIGQSFLQHGYEVTIRDVEEELLEESRDLVVSGNFGLERGVREGYLTEEEMADALDRLSYTTDLAAAVANADMVIEAIPEDLLLKEELLADLDDLTDEDVPLLSNTSGFPISALAGATDSPERVVGAHYFNPAVVMGLVEVVETPAVEDRMVETTVEVMEDTGKTPVVVEDAPTEYGFVGNRIWGAMREEARKVVDEGVASREEVNLAMRKGRNLPVGPLEGAGIGEEWGGDED
jgi:3-hydroxybutyryl-CoA dehydrogenase